MFRLRQTPLRRGKNVGELQKKSSRQTPPERELQHTHSREEKFSANTARPPSASTTFQHEGNNSSAPETDRLDGSVKSTGQTVRQPSLRIPKRRTDGQMYVCVSTFVLHSFSDCTADGADEQVNEQP